MAAAKKNDNVISTSCDVINSFSGRQRKQFSIYYLPTKLRCYSFNALEVLKGREGRGGGGGAESAKAQELKKSPGKIGLILIWPY